jgi:hypothetical protein
VWLIPYRYPSGDPNSVVEQMLNGRTYQEKCEWTGPAMRLCLYRNTPPAGLSRQDKRPEAALGDRISLRKTAIGWRASGATSEQTIAVLPGETLYVDLLWATRASTDRNYKVSMQLLDSEGRLQHQLDREPVDGFRPTSTWIPGEGIPDKYALFSLLLCRPASISLCWLCTNRKLRPVLRLTQAISLRLLISR